MSVIKELVAWNGKSAEDIGEIYDRHHNEPSFIPEIISLVEGTPVQKGATWLLKKHLETHGSCLKPKEETKLYRLLPKLEHWEARLQLLQCMPFMPIKKTSKKTVEAFLRECLADENKFVRAWAYNGFYVLSVQHQEYQQETKQLLDKALNDEAPSVKARIRNILKKH